MVVESEGHRVTQLSHAANGTREVANHDASKNDVIQRDIAKTELYTESRKFDVDFKRFYGIEPKHVDRRFVISLSGLSYLPKFDNIRADWVVTAAFQAFRAFQAAEIGDVRRFATVGTGSGTDVIAALDTFPQLMGVAMTDLHNDVVQVAKSNVLSATEKADERVREVATEAVAGSGDVLSPLKDQVPFDIIYENLPNIPLPDLGDLSSGQASATYVGDRTSDQIPHFVSSALLDLHYVCLHQAEAFRLLSRTGAILSSMGGRVPLETMLKMADVAGYVGRILGLSWKEQSEPESVIGGYAEHQKNGLGPFYFYPVAALERVFHGRSFAAAGLRAAQIDEVLQPHRLDAVAALEKHHQGIEIGHTVAVMVSVLKSFRPESNGQ